MLDGILNEKLLLSIQRLVWFLIKNRGKCVLTVGWPGDLSTADDWTLLPDLEPSGLSVEAGNVSRSLSHIGKSWTMVEDGLVHLEADGRASSDGVGLGAASGLGTGVAAERSIGGGERRVHVAVAADIFIFTSARIG